MKKSGEKYSGRPIHVDFSIPREQRQNSNGGDRGGFRGGSRGGSRGFGGGSRGRGGFSGGRGGAPSTGKKNGMLNEDFQGEIIDL